MVAALFTELGNIATAIGGAITTVFTAVISLFWSGTAVTNLGILALIASASGLVFWGFSFVLKLLRIGGK
jgi:hypothetical protein